MKLLGLVMVPFSVPMNRRLETLAVLTLFLLNLMFVGGSLLCLLLLFTRFYFITLIYIAWIYYDRTTSVKGGRTRQWFRHLTIWRYFANYFPIRLVKTTELPPTKNYIFGYHPHGIIGIGAVGNFGFEGTGFENIFPGLSPRVLTLDKVLMLPIHRETLLSLGVCSVSKESIEWLLTREGVGNALVIVVGGAAEALDAMPGGPPILTIRKRKGFVRLAMKHGASLVPVYSFGENELYSQVRNPAGSRLRQAQNWISKMFGVSPCLVYGRGVINYTFGCLPYRRPVHTVVGKPIDLEKTENPTDKEVSEIHEEYLKRLKDLYDEYKGKFGNKDHELIFK